MRTRRQYFLCKNTHNINEIMFKQMANKGEKVLPQDELKSAAGRTEGASGTLPPRCHLRGAGYRQVHFPLLAGAKA